MTTPERPTVSIEGVMPSSEVRAILKETGKPVLLAFSRGKDSIAAWIALREAGIDVIPFHLIRVPGVQFVEESVCYFEEKFDTHIYRVVHPSTLKMLRRHLFRDPITASLIDAINIPNIKYEEVDDFVRNSYAEPTTLVADGVRAVDSIRRRLSMKKTGPIYKGKVHPVWDWRKQTIRDAMADHGVDLPVDYEWFGRSWDGLQYDYIAPLAVHRPDDYEIVKQWFPLVDAVLLRRELEEKYAAQG